jgi:hypothetical protein
MCNIEKTRLTIAVSNTTVKRLYVWPVDTQKWRKKHEGINFSKLLQPYLNDRLAENFEHRDKEKQPLLCVILKKLGYRTAVLNTTVKSFIVQTPKYKKVRKKHENLFLENNATSSYHQISWKF